MWTEPSRCRAGWLAAAALLLACGTPNESAGPPPTVALRILGEPQRLLTVGAGVQLSVAAIDAQGGEVLVTGTWSSSDARVARVESPGVVRAVGYGEATITVTHAGRSATVRVTTQPKALRVRLLVNGVIVEEGEAYEVVAEFLDANDAVIAGPRDVTWEVSAGSRLLPGGNQRMQRLQAHRVGDIEVIATSGPFRALLRLNVHPRNEQKLTVSQFIMWADELPGGQMAFYPDLVVMAPFEATITRLDFDRPSMAVCGTAMVPPGDVTPLFDFIPYDFSWKSGAITPGSTVELAITIKRTDGSLVTVRAQGPLRIRDRFTVIDYGTGGFPWSVCS